MDGERVDEILVKDAKHEINRDQRRHNEEDFGRLLLLQRKRFARRSSEATPEAANR